MTQAIKQTASLHPRNRHQGRYDLVALILAEPSLSPFVVNNRFGNQSIDFANPLAVKALNKALLASWYGLKLWDIPKDYLCPPIPGRADYIHHLADLLASCNKGRVPKGKTVTGLDIGIGANGIYPIIGRMEYDWSFVGSDVDKRSLKNAALLVEANPQLKGAIKTRQQAQPSDIFNGIIKADDRFDFTLCNPPFHASAQEAQAGTQRKLSNLAANKTAQRKAAKPAKPSLNFGGQSNELWCKGGEERFIRTMAQQSAHYAEQCLWFTSLIAKKEHIRSIKKQLKKVGAGEVRVINMAQGNKVSRFIAWSFLDAAAQQHWVEQRWR